MDLRTKVLEVIQVWGLAFRNQPSYQVVCQTYDTLRMEGYPFPPPESQTEAMFVAERPPEWKEGETCFQCRIAFG